jgi:hypothetical protein
LARLSPDTTALYLVNQDLLGHRPAKKVHLGFGEPGYHASAHDVIPRASVILVRKSPANRLYRAAHRALRWLANFVKRRSQ